MSCRNFRLQELLQACLKSGKLSTNDPPVCGCQNRFGQSAQRASDVDDFNFLLQKWNMDESTGPYTLCAVDAF